MTLAKPVPLMVTVVPPAAGPEVGLMLEMVGITYVYEVEAEPIVGCPAGPRRRPPAPRRARERA